MISRLQKAHMLAIDRMDEYPEIKKQDLIMLDKMDNAAGYHTMGNSTGTSIPHVCSIGMNLHFGVADMGRRSCLCPSVLSWSWPDDDCQGHDVLSGEARRKIVRRLAYRAGVVKMTSEAFSLVFAELLHLMAILLAEAYASTIMIMSLRGDYDDDDNDEYISDVEANDIDMFNIPPPPVAPHQDLRILQDTIVPGQIRDAAKRRGIHPFHVYGDTWVASSGSTVEQEKEIEEGYYYGRDPRQEDGGGEGDTKDAEAESEGGSIEDTQGNTTEDMDYEYDPDSDEEWDDCNVDTSLFHS